jgi:2,4-dichlorophenol 6-monooxygenase
VVERANQSIAEFGAILAALGLTDPTDAEQMRANIEARKDDTPEAADQRKRLRRALQLKNYEFNAHGVEFNQRYRSAAVVPDGTEEPAFDRDAQLYYQPTTWPGARLPHCWVEHRGRRVSTIDLAGKGRFVLLTGIGGDGWVRAADAVSARTGVEIAPFVIGPGRDVLDLYDEWAGLSEISERGCVLVRPDLHVAWRSHDLVDDPSAELGRAVDAILGSAPSPSPAEPSATSGRPLTTA